MAAPPRFSQARRRALDERGQLLPIYVVAIFSVLALGAILFQVGRAATLRSDAQTAADAAALAGARELASQLISADGSTFGLDEDAVRAEAAGYAEENDARLVSFELNGCGVWVEVESEQELEGEEAEQLDVAGERASAEAAGAMGPTVGLGGGAFGAPVDGSVPAVMRPAAQLAQRLGLQITSTTGGTHAAGSYHYQGLAIDVSNSSGPTPQMEAFYDTAKQAFAGRLLELIYDPRGAIYEDGVEHPPYTEGGHSDHVHIALAPGGATGLPLDGELAGSSLGAVAGPQLVDVESVRGCALASPEAALLAGAYQGYTPGPDTAELGAAICRIGQGMGASEKVMLAAFEAGIVESGMQNLPDGDRDSAGVFQQRPSQNWGSYSQVTDPAYAAKSFFSRAIAAESDALTAGQLAQEVQRSGFPLRYDQAEADARALMAQVGCT
jgi:Putative Flp pilus-assembly TadE/G-like